MKIIIAIIIAVFFLFNTTPVFAGDVTHNYPCTPGADVCLDKKDSCLPHLQNGKQLFLDENITPAYICRVPTIEDTFGKIQPPEPLKKLLGTDQTGTGAISRFLSNTVTLIYSVAAVVLVFMFIWAAFEWMTSGGEKEKVASARNKIIYAIIGIILFALAFAILRVVGTFTGFTFFEGQNFTVHRNASGQIINVDCRNGRTLYGSFENRDYASECSK